MSTTTKDRTDATSVSGVTIPDSKLARETTELVRDTESPLLFNHSTRVYYFGSLAGKRRGLKFDSELLYVGAMFHDMGLTPQYSSRRTGSKWMALTLRELSCASTISLSRTSILCGQRLPYTRRRAFHSTCIPLLHS